MSKKRKLPKWHFSAESVFLSISENVYTQRRLNRLCRMVLAEKERRVTNDKGYSHFYALRVHISPITKDQFQTHISTSRCYSLSN